MAVLRARQRRLSSRSFYFITHPNVVISRDVPVPRWPLSALGKQRMRAGLAQPWVRDVTAIYCSTEQKAIDGAEILAQHLGLRFTEIPELGENDRSATGFLPPDEFERVADEFFARPRESVRGWERAVDAQARIVRAVGTLLYCHLAGEPISRRWDQPPNGGGNYYSFTLAPRAVHSWWRATDT